MGQIGRGLAVGAARPVPVGRGRRSAVRGRTRSAARRRSGAHGPRRERPGQGRAAATGRSGAAGWICSPGRLRRLRGGDGGAGRRPANERWQAFIGPYVDHFVTTGDGPAWQLLGAGLMAGRPAGRGRRADRRPGTPRFGSIAAWLDWWTLPRPLECRSGWSRACSTTIPRPGRPRRPGSGSCRPPTGSAIGPTTRPGHSSRPGRTRSGWWSRT